MKTPAYLPESIKKHAEHYIEGKKEHQWEGWESIISNNKKKLKDLNEENKHIHNLHPSEKTRILKRIKEAEESIAYFSPQVECIKRLVLDESMKEVYELLELEDYSPEELEFIIYSAWTSDLEYGKYRDEIASANDKKLEIAKAAKKLSKLLNQLYKIGMEVPSELHYIPSLIEASTHGEDEHNYYIWNITKKSVVSYSYAWEKSPPISALIDVIAQTAENYLPNHNFSIVQGAIISRERNVKVEYIRALATRLLEKKFKLNTNLKKAIAIITNVVLNSPDIDTTYADVKQAVKKLSNITSDNSA